MAKNVVVCLDGTWNKPELISGSPSREFPSNVYRVWLGLGGPSLNDLETLEASASAKNAALIYVRGIGSGGAELRKKIDGAAGIGMGKRVRAAYGRIQSVYQPGDRLFIFGFSRGSFAARSLASLIGRYGVSKRASAEEIYERYRQSLPPEKPSVSVNFLGLWDTVGAIALPEALLSFHSMNPQNCSVIRHALALDEVRTQFAPIFFGNVGQKTNLKEVWFAGAHSNVGGGYENANLSNIGLFWMLAEAARAGLQVNLPEVTGFMNEKEEAAIDSYSGFWRPKRYIGDFVTALGAYQEARTVPGHHRLHQSVLEDRPAGYKPLAKLPGGMEAYEMEPWGIADDGKVL